MNLSQACSTGIRRRSGLFAIVISFFAWRRVPWAQIERTVTVASGAAVVEAGFYFYRRCAYGSKVYRLGVEEESGEVRRQRFSQAVLGLGTISWRSLPERKARCDIFVA